MNADVNQFETALLNLVVNARDAMPAGGQITITTRILEGVPAVRRHAAAKGSFVAVEVEDSGSGIGEDVLQHIFEPFFTTKHGNQGPGLGLAVVYGIVVAHHGFIDVESAPGMGSTFRVYLPLAETAAAVPVQAGPGEFPGGTESLLIVDDELSLRSLLSTALSRKGYHTTMAASGLEAAGEEIKTQLSELKSAVEALQRA